MTEIARTVRRSQGLYYVATGLWPVVATHHYMTSVGQDSHPWAARILGVVVAGLGAALAADVLPERWSRRLAIGTAVMLGAGAAVFVARGKGVPVNLTDGLVQAGFAITAARTA